MIPVPFSRALTSQAIRCRLAGGVVYSDVVIMSTNMDGDSVLRRHIHTVCPKLVTFIMAYRPYARFSEDQYVNALQTRNALNVKGPGDAFEYPPQGQ